VCATCESGHAQHVCMHVQGLATVLLFAKDARGNVKPHALRLQCDANGTVLSPLLVAPANVADTGGMAGNVTSLQTVAGEDTQADSGEPANPTEHGFWSANATWSPDGNLAGVHVCPALQLIPSTLVRVKGQAEMQELWEQRFSRCLRTVAAGCSS